MARPNVTLIFIHIDARHKKLKKMTQIGQYLPCALHKLLIVLIFHGRGVTFKEEENLQLV